MRDATPPWKADKHVCAGFSHLTIYSLPFLLYAISTHVDNDILVPRHAYPAHLHLVHVPRPRQRVVTLLHHRQTRSASSTFYYDRAYRITAPTRSRPLLCTLRLVPPLPYRRPYLVYISLLPPFLFASFHLDLFLQAGLCFNIVRRLYRRQPTLGLYVQHSERMLDLYAGSIRRHWR
jgi:hypothetical protein